ncbi:MAG: hypothetical protein ACK559_29290, partial [bacterium]
VGPDLGHRRAVLLGPALLADELGDLVARLLGGVLRLLVVVAGLLAHVPALDGLPEGDHLVLCFRVGADEGHEPAVLARVLRGGRRCGDGRGAGGDRGGEEATCGQDHGGRGGGTHGTHRNDARPLPLPCVSVPMHSPLD